MLSPRAAGTPPEHECFEGLKRIAPARSANAEKNQGIFVA
jgi:hypothetical protein